MQQARVLIEQTDYAPEIKEELVATYDKIVESVAERCPQEKRDDLGNAVAEAVVALAKVGQRDKDRLYAFALAKAWMFLSSDRQSYR
jgi:hypothetical protein